MKVMSVRIVFMGTPQFAVPALERLAPSVQAVVTQPDRRRGRGQQLWPSPIKAAALALGLPVLQPERVREESFLNQLRELKPDLITVVAFGQILPPALLAIPPLGCINVHASLLPRLRGAAPIQRSIMNGDTRTGVCTMYMDQGLDTGDVIYQEEEIILPEDTAGSLAQRLAVKGADLLCRTVKAIEQGIAPSQPQDSSLASWAPPITKEEEIIRWDKGALQLANQIRGLNPRPGAVTFALGMRLKIWRARAISDKTVAGNPGQVLKIEGEAGILVSTPDGALLVQEVQPAGKRIMTAAEYARGYRVRPGDVWG